MRIRTLPEESRNPPRRSISIEIPKVEANYSAKKDRELIRSCTTYFAQKRTEEAGFEPSTFELVDCLEIEALINSATMAS